ncbi:hypothetical protein JTB14_035955 [Gonioctena quinquepunctata]|nr:hypothetical protein JTB14_035955 [Gonioctena quinquepunctata]
MDHLEINAETTKTEDDITADLMDAIREADDILFPDSESEEGNEETPTEKPGPSVTDRANSPQDQAMDSDRSDSPIHPYFLAHPKDRAFCPRSTAVLYNCWKNLKAEGRKVAADERQARIKTGRGLKKYVAVDPIIFRVIDLIRPTAVGLINSCDTDSVLGNTMSQNEDNCIPEIEVLGETQANGGSNSNGD